MKRSLFFLLIFFLLRPGTSVAQHARIEFTVTNASAIDSCDGAMEINCLDCPYGPLTYTWFDSLGNVIGTGAAVTGVCPTWNFCPGVMVEDLACNAFLFYASVKVASVSGPEFSVRTYLRFDSLLTPNYLNMEEVSGGVSPYYYSLYDDYSGDGLPVTYDSLVAADSGLASILNVQIDSICDIFGNTDGFFNLGVGDSTENFIGYYFTPVLWDSTACSPYAGLWLSAQSYPVSDSSLCDGWAYAVPYGGTPPYTFSFSSGATDSTESGLCPGAYIATVTDALSDTYSSTCIVGYPGTMYFSEMASLSYLDTLYTNAATECGLDYSMPLDSFYVDTSYYLVGGWSYVVEWVLIQDTNVYDFTETYHMDSTGCYMFGLSVYCDARSAFGSYSLFYGMDTGNGSVGIAERKNDPAISLYPNPSRGIYHLTSSHAISSYRVIDQLSGNLISGNGPFPAEGIDLSHFSSGVYYLEIIFRNGQQSVQKLIRY